MSMTVEIRISGLAIFYQIGNVWQIVFICDATHPVNFKHGSAADWTTLAKPDENRDISVYADKQIENGFKGDNYEQILNMAKDMHGNGKLKVRRSGERRLVFLSIPSAKIDCQTPTNDRYYIIEPDGKFRYINSVAKTVKASIQMEKGNGLTMIIKDNDGTSLLASVPFNEKYTDKQPYPIEFYNDCEGESSESNDFLIYYEWVKDKDNENKKFTAGRVNGNLKDILDAAEKNGETVNIFDEKVILSPENGNCDPVVIDPPPVLGGN